MEIVALVVLAGVGAVALLTAVAWARRRVEPAATEPPPRAWKSDTVTPVIRGPRSKAPERVARPFVVTQGALLAMHMAAADGEVTAAERDALRDFVLHNETDVDAPQAEAAVKEAEARLHNPIAIESALDALRALGSEEQRKLVVELLVHVAHSDGVVRPEEIAFMKRVGRALGLTEDDVQAKIELP